VGDDAARIATPYVPRLPDLRFAKSRDLVFSPSLKSLVIPNRSLGESRVPLDKSEGSVKDKNLLGSAGAPRWLPERLRTKTLEISR